MFASSVELLPKDAFKTLLDECRGSPRAFVPLLEELWKSMNEGMFSTTIRKQVLKFNGNLFVDAKALPLGREEIGELYEAAQKDWHEVEPAIFGTLLEQALDPAARLCRAARGCHDHRAFARGLAQRASHGGNQARGRRQERRGRCREGVPRQAVRDARARSGLRHRQFPLRVDGIDEASRGRGAGSPARPRRTRGVARIGRPYGRSASVLGNGNQSARGGHRGAGAVDRLSAMALPHQRRHSRRTDPAAIQEYRSEGRGTDVGRLFSAASDRRQRGTSKSAETDLADGGVHRGESAVHRRKGYSLETR
jgi:hypothetical protein